MIYPNPSSGNSILKYSLARKSSVEIGIYNLEGKLINSFNVGVKQEGIHEYQIPTQALGQGMYFVKVKSNNNEKQLKLTQLSETQK